MAFASAAFTKTKINPRFSFSTLGCPKWTLNQMIKFAAENGYQGIELRGINGEMDITRSSDFNTKEKISSTLKTLEDKGLEIICVASVASFHHADKAKWNNNLDEGKRYVDMAIKLNSPYVRVFPDKLPQGQDLNVTIDLISQGLIELGTYAKGSKVTVLLEAHGDFTGTGNLVRIMEKSKGPNVGMIWDICNMWSGKKESPSLIFENLKKYIKHTHFTDFVMINNKLHSTLLGEGEAPVREAVNVLVNGNYDGYYGLEWEKLWEPDIEEPEIAFPQFISEMKNYF